MRQGIQKRNGVIGMRNLVFGVEDGLVSTVGFVSGIAVGGLSMKDIILTGTVLVFVEAFSMAMGSFLSETSAEEFERSGPVPFGGALLGSVIMFFSYIVAGGLILLPYFLFTPMTALYYSISVSLGALFVLGFTSSRLSGISSLRQPIRMVIVGGLAVAFGIIIARFTNGF